MITEQLQKKIDRAVKLLQSVANGYDGEIEVAYSGGKDSDVILQLAKESGIRYRAVYKNTTIDPSGTIAHAKAMGAEVVRPKETFFQIIARAGFPHRNRRICCDVLKEYQYDKTMQKVVIGVRKSESRKRNELYDEPTKCLGTKKKPYEAIYPLLDWTDADVREFILDRKIKCAPVYYDENGTFHVERRLGCMCCPLVYYKRRIKEFQARPNMVKAYLRASRKYLETHPDSEPKAKYHDEYAYFVRNLFFDREEKFEMFDQGIFGRPDYKKFLEEFFNITL